MNWSFLSFLCFANNLTASQRRDCRWCFVRRTLPKSSQITSCRKMGERGRLKVKLVKTCIRRSWSLAPDYNMPIHLGTMTMHMVWTAWMLLWMTVDQCNRAAEEQNVAFVPEAGHRNFNITSRSDYFPWWTGQDVQLPEARGGSDSPQTCSENSSTVAVLLCLFKCLR